MDTIKSLANLKKNYYHQEVDNLRHLISENEMKVQRKLRLDQMKRLEMTSEEKLIIID